MNRIGLFSAKLGRFRNIVNGQTRGLKTDFIYPYPNYYYTQTECLSQTLYRETWEPPHWYYKEAWVADKLHIIFWAWFSYQLYDDPGALIGHHHLPDPEKWTDEELGVPPPEAGSYKEWLEKKNQSST